MAIFVGVKNGHHFIHTRRLWLLFYCEFTDTSLAILFIMSPICEKETFESLYLPIESLSADNLKDLTNTPGPTAYPEQAREPAVLHCVKQVQVVVEVAL